MADGTGSDNVTGYNPAQILSILTYVTQQQDLIIESLSKRVSELESKIK